MLDVPILIICVSVILSAITSHLIVAFEVRYISKLYRNNQELFLNEMKEITLEVIKKAQDKQ